MDELAKLLSYKINQLTNHSAPEETLHSRALTPQEVNQALCANSPLSITD